MSKNFDHERTESAAQLELVIPQWRGAQYDAPYMGGEAAIMPRRRAEPVGARPMIAPPVGPDASTATPQSAVITEATPWIDEMPELAVAPLRCEVDADAVLGWWEEARRKHGTSDESVLTVESARIAAEMLLDAAGPVTTLQLIESYHGKWEAAREASGGDLTGEPAIELLVEFRKKLTNALWFGRGIPQAIWHGHVAAAAAPHPSWRKLGVPNECSPEPGAETGASVSSPVPDPPNAAPLRAESGRRRLAAFAKWVHRERIGDPETGRPRPCAP